MTETKVMPADQVFVGNLSYSITEETLKEMFSSVGEVTGVQLITRFGRSKGFGFISMSSETKCEDAVKKYHDFELEGRPMNVEIARPKTEFEAKARLDDEEPKKERKPRQPRNEGDDAASKPKAEKAARSPKEKVERAPKEKVVRAPRENVNRNPSKTMVFVGNLPFKVVDEDLGAMFQKYGVKTARVVIGKFGRSKGFGFVDFNSHEDQLQVLKDFTDAVITVNERKLIVNAAFELDDKETKE